MKKTIIPLSLLILFLFALRCSAQKNKHTPKNEIGISFLKYSFSFLNGDYLQLPLKKNEKSFHSKFNYHAGNILAFPELYYSRFIGKTAKLRTSFFVTDFKETVYYGFPTPQENNFRQTTFALGLGMQQNFFEHKTWTPYLLFDVIGNYNKYEFVPSPQDFSPWPMIIRDDAYKPFQLDARIGFGFSTFLYHQKFSASIESVFALRDETVLPVSRFSLNYHF